MRTQVDVLAALLRPVILHDELAADVRILGVVAYEDAAAPTPGGVASEFSAGERQLVVGVDAATVIVVRFVAGDRAALERELSRTVVAVIVEDAAALLPGRVVADGAPGEHRLAEVLDAAALLGLRVVAADGDASRVEVGALRDLRAAAVVFRGVLGQRAADHVHGAVAQVDACAVVVRRVLLDFRVGYRQRLALRVHEKASAAIVRFVVGDAAVRDPRALALQELDPGAVVVRLVVGDVRAGQVYPAALGHVDAAAAIVGDVACDGAARHLEGTLHQHAGAVVVAAVAGDAAARYGARGARVHVDAATVVGVAAGYPAATLAVANRQGRILEQLDDVTGPLLGREAPAEGVPGQVDCYALVAVDLDAALVRRAGQRLGQLDDVAARGCRNSILELLPGACGGVGVLGQVRLPATVDGNGVTTVLRGEVFPIAFAVQAGCDVAYGIHHVDADSGAGIERSRDREESPGFQVDVAAGVVGNVQVPGNLQGGCVAVDAAALAVSRVARDRRTRHLRRAAAGDEDAAAVRRAVGGDRHPFDCERTAPGDEDAAALVRRAAPDGPAAVLAAVDDAQLRARIDPDDATLVGAGTQLPVHRLAVEVDRNVLAGRHGYGGRVARVHGLDQLDGEGAVGVVDLLLKHGPRARLVLRLGARGRRLDPCLQRRVRRQGGEVGHRIGRLEEVLLVLERLVQLHDAAVGARGDLDVLRGLGPAEDDGAPLPVLAVADARARSLGRRVDLAAGDGHCGVPVLAAADAGALGVARRGHGATGNLDVAVVGVAAGRVAAADAGGAVRARRGHGATGNLDGAAVGVAARADARAVVAAGGGHGAAGNGDRGAVAVHTAADAGAVVAAGGGHGAARDVHGAANPGALRLAAADARAVVAALGDHGAAGDLDGARVAALAAADARAVVAAGRGHLAAEDLDGPAVGAAQGAGVLAVAAADAGPVVSALGRHVAAADGDVAALAGTAAADAGPGLAARGLHLATVDRYRPDVGPVVVVAADAGAVLGAVRDDMAAVDDDVAALVAGVGADGGAVRGMRVKLAGVVSIALGVNSERLAFGDVQTLDVELELVGQDEVGVVREVNAAVDGDVFVQVVPAARHALAVREGIRRVAVGLLLYLGAIPATLDEGNRGALRLESGWRERSRLRPTRRRLPDGPCLRVRRQRRQTDNHRHRDQNCNKPANMHRLHRRTPSHR